jgi:hypothetical protein
MTKQLLISLAAPETSFPYSHQDFDSRAGPTRGDPGGVRQGCPNEGRWASPLQTLAEVLPAHPGVNQNWNGPQFEQREADNQKLWSRLDHQDGAGTSPQPDRVQAVRTPIAGFFKLSITELTLRMDQCNPIGSFDG